MTVEECPTVSRVQGPFIKGNLGSVVRLVDAVVLPLGQNEYENFTVGYTQLVRADVIGGTDGDDAHWVSGTISVGSAPPLNPALAAAYRVQVKLTWGTQKGTSTAMFEAGRGVTFAIPCTNINVYVRGLTTGGAADVNGSLAIGKRVCTSKLVASLSTSDLGAGIPVGVVIPAFADTWAVYRKDQANTGTVRIARDLFAFYTESIAAGTPFVHGDVGDARTLTVTNGGPGLDAYTILFGLSL